MPTLLLVRGLPGSGKSTFGRMMRERGFLHYEADQWMLDDEGNYKFDSSRLRMCHESCQSHVYKALGEGWSVVVTNTFVKRWELQPYLSMARWFHTEVFILTMEGKYKNIHGVPEEKVQQMANNWEEMP